jgi:hypothetical protein
VNWETLYCPHQDYRGYWKPFTAGLLVKKWQQPWGTESPLQRLWGEYGLELRHRILQLES